MLPASRYLLAGSLLPTMAARVAGRLTRLARELRKHQAVGADRRSGTGLTCLATVFGLVASCWPRALSCQPPAATWSACPIDPSPRWGIILTPTGLRWFSVTVELLGVACRPD
jgi:hypothetical protein